MLGLLSRFKNQLFWISGTVALTSVWLALFIYSALMKSALLQPPLRPLV